MGAWLGGGGGMSRRSMRSPDEFGAYVQRELLPYPTTRFASTSGNE